MLTNDQLWKLQKAGCPMIVYYHNPINGESSYTWPTIEEMMGWMRRKYKRESVHVGGYGSDDTPENDVFIAWSNDQYGIPESSNDFPDALSALYDLWERLEGDRQSPPQ